MADQKLIFHGWKRERIAGLATGTQDGRARVETEVTLTGTAVSGTTTGSHSRPVRFLLGGPADVTALAPASITRRYPSPGAPDHESDRCPYVELADPSLPWRYTPAPKPAAGTGSLHPWLVLVVGFENDEVIIAGKHVTLSPAVQAAHPLGAAGDPYPWGHVQVDAEGRQVARVLSGRPLEAGTAYVAVLVPAFDEAGQKRWNGTGPVTVPAYDHWRFHTATPPGSFEDLAAILKPGAVPDGIGRAPLVYPRLPDGSILQVRGALSPLGVGDDPVPQEISADLGKLRTPARDDEGRPIIGLPPYGEVWRAAALDEMRWEKELNTDPRHRGIAGLGLEIGLRLQEELSAEASASLGALAEARQRIRDLVMGLHAAGLLWRRRLPEDPLDALWFLGPALGRVVTPEGSVAELATAPDRALPEGIFSTAARRALRAGTARTSALKDGPVVPKTVLAAANRCPPPSERRGEGIPLGELGIDIRDLLERVRAGAAGGRLDYGAIVDGAHELAELAANSLLRELAFGIVKRFGHSAKDGTPAPWVDGLALLISAASVNPDDMEEVDRLAEVMRSFLDRYPEPAGEQDLSRLIADIDEPQPEDPACRPVDLGALAAGVLAAFDPTRDDSAARTRVLATIDGLDPRQPLAPPEFCVGLDRPVWADVEEAFPEWLLPGAAALPEDSVIAVETNPRFVDALLIGLNTQVLGEWRWRNIPVATGCTPLRVFWDRADTGNGARLDDITGVAAWADATSLGDPEHRPPGIAGRDLVVLVRGQLFLRYPATVVYLTPVHMAEGTADFEVDPDPAARILPTFQGRIGADMSFFGFQGVEPERVLTHWIVFEEPPAGFRFANDKSSAGEPHTWATKAFVPPVRVLIRGDRLAPGRS
ncbi:hypothetical protein ACH9D2_06625 [Kocuria sp. M4R2S49]|uniref:hypothetical protein n=1 Tax=Kocuria rhizosphaericola TaxID=3376284 RepID=UPI0037B56555